MEERHKAGPLGGRNIGSCSVWGVKVWWGAHVWDALCDACFVQDEVSIGTE